MKFPLAGNDSIICAITIFVTSPLQSAIASPYNLIRRKIQTLSVPWLLVSRFLLFLLEYHVVLYLSAAVLLSWMIYIPPVNTCESTSFWCIFTYQIYIRKESGDIPAVSRVREPAQPQSVRTFGYPFPFSVTVSTIFQTSSPIRIFHAEHLKTRPHIGTPAAKHSYAFCNKHSWVIPYPQEWKAE